MKKTRKKYHAVIQSKGWNASWPEIGIQDRITSTRW